MRQRVGIAQALLGDPKLVIVDEPTVGLDPEERVRFRNLLSEIAHGRVVILSTHIVSDVEAVATRIAILRGGRLVGVAAPEELLARASGRSSPPSCRRRRSRASSRPCRCPASCAAPTACTCATSDAADALAGATAAEPTLEDAYLLASLGEERAA